MVIGVTDDQNGVTIITEILECVLLIGGCAIPDTILGTTEDLSGMEEWEGTWCQTGGFLLDEPGNGDIVVRIDDGSGAVEVRIFAATGIDAMDGFGIDDWFMVQGVISIDDDEVQIIPSLVGDVWREEMIEPENLAIEEFDEGTGAYRITWDHPEEDELDGFLYYYVYLNEDQIATTTAAHFNNKLPEPDHNETYNYSLAVTAVYHEGESEFCEPVQLEWVVDWLSIEENAQIPKEWAIKSAYPNPFNSSVRVTIAVPEISTLDIAVFDILGRMNRQFDSRKVNAGYYKFEWYAKQPSGIYFLQVSSQNGWSETVKLVYMK
jgi:hypothetical protein